MNKYSPSDPEIIRGRIWLLIAIGLIFLFVEKSLLADWRTGRALSELVEFPSVMMLLCVFLYRGSSLAKGCMGVLLTFLVGVFSLILYSWIAPYSKDLRQEALVSRLSATVNRDFLIFCVGLVYCWWALLFSDSVKVFLEFQQAKRKKRR